MKITGKELYQILMQRKPFMRKVGAEEIQKVKNAKVRLVLTQIARIDKSPKNITPKEFEAAAKRINRVVDQKTLDAEARRWAGVVRGLTAAKAVKSERLLPAMAEDEWGKISKKVGDEDDVDAFSKITDEEWAEIYKKNGWNIKSAALQGFEDSDLFCVMSEKDLEKLLAAQKRKNEVVVELNGVVKELKAIRDYMNQLDQTVDNNFPLTDAQTKLKEVEAKEARAIDLEEKEKVLKRELKSLQKEIDLIEQEQVDFKKVGVEIDTLLKEYGNTNDHDVPPELPVVTRVIKLPKAPVIGR
jgi:hypothetical protein